MTARAAELNKRSGVSRRQFIQAIGVSGMGLGIPVLLGTSSTWGAGRPFVGATEPLAAKVKAKIAAGGSFRIPGSLLEMLPLSSGTVTMGRPSGPPLSQVKISRPFWLGKTEVTQAQYERVMDVNPSKFKGSDLPVEDITWDDATEFCRKLTAQAKAGDWLPKGFEFTLPTEAQWEYASRAGTIGDVVGELDAVAWYVDNSGKKTHPVGQKAANAWGFYDMQGNVWEWCLDWYGDYPRGQVTDYAGAASGPERVLRGGGWYSTASRWPLDLRLNRVPGFHTFALGFRLALVQSGEV